MRNSFNEDPASREMHPHWTRYRQPRVSVKPSLFRPFNRPSIAKRQHKLDAESHEPDTFTGHEAVRGNSCRVGRIPQIRDRLVGEPEPLHDDRAGGGRGVPFLLPQGGQHVHPFRQVRLPSRELERTVCTSSIALLVVPFATSRCLSAHRKSQHALASPSFVRTAGVAQH